MQYKKITAIVRRGRLEKVEESLKDYGVKGISVTRVKGFGEYANFFDRDWMCEHARIEIFTREAELEPIVQSIMEAGHTGHAGDGMVAVLPVEMVYRVRTKQPARPDEI